MFFVISLIVYFIRQTWFILATVIFYLFILLSANVSSWASLLMHLRIRICPDGMTRTAKMKLDGTAVKPGKAVTKKGTHKLIIWSKDGKVQRVTFKIK